MHATMIPVNNVKEIPPEKAKAILSGIVEICLHAQKYDLSHHSTAWNFLVENSAINIRSME